MTKRNNCTGKRPDFANQWAFAASAENAEADLRHAESEFSLARQLRSDTGRWAWLDVLQQQANSGR